MHVDKELCGDTFRLPPRLTPLEARAIRLALEFVGPMIAASTPTPRSTRVRAKLEETFGQFDARRRRPTSQAEQAEEDLVSTLARGMREHRLVEIEYQKEVDRSRRAASSSRTRSRARLPYWYVHTWDRTSGGERSLPARPDAQREAHAREVRAARGFRARAAARRAQRRVLYAKEIARCEIERGARRLANGTALRELPVGSDEWLESEILSKRGDAVVLEPAELRARIAARARALAKELGVERLRARV